MKLELKHLAPYLPYGLKIAHRDAYCHTRDYEYILSPEKVEYVIDYSERFPILRPLSDLYKEIEVNGEKFVPIVKLCEKLNHPLEKYELDNQVVYGFEQRYADDSEAYSVAFDPKSKTIGIYYDDEALNPFENEFAYDIGNYDTVVQLFEWHFDVFGLIDQGLAIDINEIK